MLPVVRDAVSSDHAELNSFLNRKHLLLHHHLDWRSPLDWLGEKPFLVVERNGQMASLLICTFEIPGVYWIRIFASDHPATIEEDFSALIQSANDQIKVKDPEAIIATIIYLDWMKNLVERSGFSYHQQIVQLKWKPSTLLELDSKRRIIRPMVSSDLDRVTAIDQTCFDRIWKLSLESIQQAFRLSAYATVVESENEIAGYQISTIHRTKAHIARLAVLPRFQRQGFGSMLVRDILRHFRRKRMREFTVNTQIDNHCSLRLYQKIGFEKTADRFPIYILM